MRNRILVAIVIWLGAFGPPAISLGTTDSSALGLQPEIGCCGSTVPTNPDLFATGCYQGSGTDDRRIATGIPLANAGLVVICELTAEAGNSNVCAYSMPGLSAGVSCAYTNADFDPSGAYSPCGLDRIQSIGNQYFEIGTATEVNSAGRVYCWSEWGSKAGFHGDVVYTGDGTANRNIAVSGGTPSAAVVWSVVTSSSAENIPWIRTADMAANTSFPADQNATADETQRVRDFSNGNVIVGTSSNVSSREYHLAWWAQGSNQKLTSYTGDGTGLDAGRCGSLANTKVITAACTPVRNTWLTVTQGAGAGTCTLTRSKGRCNRWRSVATGFGVTGPGNIANSSDLYGYTGIQPNNSGPGLLGAFSGATYTVSGGANAVSSCNDTAVPYYGFVTCASGPVIGAQNAADWTFDTALVNWDMEEADSSTRTNNATLGFCSPSTNCDLANTGTVLKDTSLFKQGTASAAYSGGTDLLSCSLSTCSALKLTAAVTVTGWIRPGAASDCEMVESEAGQSQYRMFWRNASQGARWNIRTTGSVDYNITSSGWASGNWHHVTGTFSDAANSMQLFVDGVSVSTDTPPDMHSIGNGTFEVGGNTPTCNLDEVGIWNKKLTDTDVCRIYSCGIDGRQCSCLAADPTVYVSTGRWTPGACTLPACNKAATS